MTSTGFAQMIKRNQTWKDLYSNSMYKFSESSMEITNDGVLKTYVYGNNIVFNEFWELIGDEVLKKRIDRSSLFFTCNDNSQFYLEKRKKDSESYLLTFLNEINPIWLISID